MQSGGGEGLRGGTLFLLSSGTQATFGCALQGTPSIDEIQDEVLPIEGVMAAQKSPATFGAMMKLHS